MCRVVSIMYESSSEWGINQSAPCAEVVAWAQGNGSGWPPLAYL